MVKFTFQGEKFEVSTPQEAAELWILLKGGHSVKSRKRGRHAKTRPVAVDFTPSGRGEQEKLADAIRALQVVEKAGQDGIESSKLIEELKLPHGRLSLGPLKNVINRRLKEKGFLPDEVVRIGNRDGAAVWVRGNHIGAAINSLLARKVEGGC